MGLYSFLLLGFIANSFLKIGHNGGGRTPILLAGLSVLTGIEALLEMTLRMDPGNLTRFITGAVSGCAIGFLLTIGIHGKEDSL
jgi:hypothetical protein